VGDDRAMQAVALTYLSDDLPTESVISLHPDFDPSPAMEDLFMTASLDHASYFHRPSRRTGALQTYTATA
jgi:acyl-CoA thioesterase